jgi:4-hydroxybenzoate polyprenyltransferase
VSSNEATSSNDTTRSSSRTMALAELLRLPNVFTALADILAGYLVTHTGLVPWSTVALLGGASCAIYLAGMVLNDVYDVEVDRRERPERPLPSGRISLPAARLWGFELLLLGVALGWSASFFSGEWRCGVVATVLAATVWAYDGVLKKTPVGPVAMGGCRALNLLLGMSAAAHPWHAVHFLLAAAVGIYVGGLTWFARTEAVTSRRRDLVGACIVMAAGVALVAWFPAWADEQLPPVSRPVYVDPVWWPAMILLLGVAIARRFVAAVAEPTAANVQRAVGSGILSLVVIDAVICAAVRGPQWGIVVLVLIFPGSILRRWIRLT